MNCRYAYFCICEQLESCIFHVSPLPFHVFVLANSLQLAANSLPFPTFAPKLSSSTMVYLTRVEHFNAAHRLYNPRWTPEQNEAAFGKCAGANWHGHNYELYVTVKGKPSADTGFVVDVKALSSIINQHVIDHLDHKNLNVDVPFMKDQLCSTENLAIAIWQQLLPHLPNGVQLHGIKLYETPRIFVEYFGE
jgi:6-pyruvoyltetrahydropterin/6-carboxytetrahydropterin synthase